MSLSQKIGHVKELCGRFFHLSEAPLPSYDRILPPPPHILYTCIHVLYTYSCREGGEGGGRANQREG
jgi:hypothetical protein